MKPTVKFTWTLMAVVFAAVLLIPVQVMAAGRAVTVKAGAAPLVEGPANDQTIGEWVPPALDLKTAPPQRRGIAVLPSIGSPGKTAPLAQNIIRIGAGSNEMVYVGLGIMNRIATPFRTPKIVEAAGINFKRVGQDFYFVPDKEGPIGVFIAETAQGNAPGQVAALTLIPKAGLPGQNILLLPEGMDGVSPGDGTATFAPRAAQEELAAPPSDYADAIRQILVTLVQGAVPSGYQEGGLKVGAARVGSILTIPEKLYVGYAFNIYRYRIENAGREPIDLNEASFHDDGVRAVAFWRNSRLAPGEATRVFIVADRRAD